MIELVVAMLISAIVISIVFYAYSLLSNQLRKQQVQSGKITEYVLFQRAFKRDVERAVEIRDSADSGQLILRTDQQVIRYSIGSGGILRSLNGIVDTFFLEGRITGKEYVSDSIPLIKIIQLKIVVNKESLILPARKDYTTRDLIRAENELHE
jgi:type II secretory pathway pseudopilin PulG